MPTRRNPQYVDDPIEDRARLLLRGVAQQTPGARPEEVLDRADLRSNGAQRDVVTTTDALLNSPRAPWIELVTLRGADARARALAVSIAAELLAPAGGDFLSQAVARIVFGAGACAIDAQVDVGPRGQSFVLHASALSIQVAASGSGTVRFRGHVGYAAGPASRPPSRTRIAASIAAGADADLAVPAFATEIALQRTPDTEPYRWSAVRQNGAVVTSGLVAAGQGQELVRLPPDAELVRVTNLGVNALTFVRGIFLLELA